MRSRRENHTSSLRQPEQATRGPLRATGATGLHKQLRPAPWHAGCMCHTGALRAAASSPWHKCDQQLC